MSCRSLPSILLYPCRKYVYVFRTHRLSHTTDSTSLFPFDTETGVDFSHEAFTEWTVRVLSLTTRGLSGSVTVLDGPVGLGGGEPTRGHRTSSDDGSRPTRTVYHDSFPSYLPKTFKSDQTFTNKLSEISIHDSGRRFSLSCLGPSQEGPWYRSRTLYRLIYL